MDESLMPVVALVLAALIALCFGLWAATGGRIGRWIGAALLVWWILWVGEIVIGRTYPHWLYTPEERVFMARLEQAINEGKERVALREVLPFEWEAACYITIGADGVSENDRRALFEAMGQDVVFDTGWHVFDSIGVDYVEGFFALKTPKGVVVMRDLSGLFGDYVFDTRLNRFVGVGHLVGVEYEGQPVGYPTDRFCDEVGDKISVRIEHVD